MRRASYTKRHSLYNVKETEDSEDTEDSKDSDRLRTTHTVFSYAERGFAASPEETQVEEKTRHDTSQFFDELADLPFAEFVAAVCDQDRALKDIGEIQEWQGAWWFAWALRGHPDMRPFLKQPAKGFKAVERVLTDRSKQFGMQGDDCWEDWFNVAKPDARGQFIDAWIGARFMPGQGPLQQAYDFARAQPLQLPQDIADKRSTREPGECPTDDYDFFISLSGWLQTIMGDQPIKLPCHKIADIMKVSSRTIGRYRTWAIEDGLLKQVREHTFVRPGSNRNEATSFRFDVSHWNTLSDKAQPGTINSFDQA